MKTHTTARALDSSLAPRRSASARDKAAAHRSGIHLREGYGGQVRHSAFGIRHFSFTLIEMLVVMAVILLLAALLFPALNTARRSARTAAAKAEVKQIETAWRQYYTEYEMWPSFASSAGPIALMGDVAEVLTSGEASTNNPRRLRFMQFKRLNASGSPVTPWGEQDTDDASTAGDKYYYVMFDVNYDNLVKDDDCPLVPSEPWMRPLTNDVRRRVIAWTVNGDREPGEEGYVIGSWLE